jgi:hypothetical protein
VALGFRDISGPFSVVGEFAGWRHLDLEPHDYVAGAFLIPGEAKLCSRRGYFAVIFWDWWYPISTGGSRQKGAVGPWLFCGEFVVDCW